MLYPFRLRRMTNSDTLALETLWQPDRWLPLCTGTLETNQPGVSTEAFAAVRGQELCGELTLARQGEVVTFQMFLAPDQTGRATGEAFIRTCLEFLCAKFPDARLIQSSI